MMANGRNASSNGLLQGNKDTTIKSEKQTTLGSIKSVEDLEHRVQALTSNQHLVMENVETNLKIVLVGTMRPSRHTTRRSCASQGIARVRILVCTCIC